MPNIEPIADRPDGVDPDLPPDNGQRASFDRETGEVHGSGVGAGGGESGEDFDSDAAAGDGGKHPASEDGKQHR